MRQVVIKGQSGDQGLTLTLKDSKISMLTSRDRRQVDLDLSREEARRLAETLFAYSSRVN